MEGTKFFLSRTSYFNLPNSENRGAAHGPVRFYVVSFTTTRLRYGVQGRAQITGDAH